MEQPLIKKDQTDQRMTTRLVVQSFLAGCFATGLVIWALKVALGDDNLGFKLLLTLIVTTAIAGQGWAAAGQKQHLDHFEAEMKKTTTLNLSTVSLLDTLTAIEAGDISPARAVTILNQDLERLRSQIPATSEYFSQVLEFERQINKLRHRFGEA